LVETHDWKNEPMVLISSGQLIEQLGLDKTKRRFSFAELTGSAELQRFLCGASACPQSQSRCNSADPVNSATKIALRFVQPKLLD